ncbi:unnamed protein product [Peniophora sp. CBMAI 1063]|nr:unnamed protein product [Peniophora sp. CBMAI 1063]
MVRISLSLQASFVLTFVFRHSQHPTQSRMLSFTFRVFTRAHLQIEGSVHNKALSKELAIGALNLSALAVQKAFKL